MKFILLVAFVALSAACFSGVSASKTWTLTEANNNTNITPTLGDTVVLKLKGNPTTGHKWILECLSGDAVTFPTPRTYEANGGGHGNGGTFTFTFNVVSPGHGSVFLKYSRNWTGVAANTFLVSWHASRPTIAENEDI